MLQPSSILAHFTFHGSQWRWMFPLHYTSFWVKWWTHVSQHHHGIREPVGSSIKWLKKWKSTCKHKFLWTSITFLDTHRTHTLLYPSCTWTMLGTVFTNHYSAMDKSWIVSWWFFKTSSTTCTVFTCSWSASCPETSVRTYQYSLRSNPEERSFPNYLTSWISSSLKAKGRSSDEIPHFLFL
jgi:hypothetical protein